MKTGYFVALLTVTVLAVISYLLRVPSYLIDRLADCILTNEEIENFNRTARSGYAQSKR